MSFTSYSWHDGRKRYPGWYIHSYALESSRFRNCPQQCHDARFSHGLFLGNTIAWPHLPFRWTFAHQLRRRIANHRQVRKEGIKWTVKDWAHQRMHVVDTCHLLESGISCECSPLLGLLQFFDRRILIIPTATIGHIILVRIHWVIGWSVDLFLFHGYSSILSMERIFGWIDYCFSWGIGVTCTLYSRTSIQILLRKNDFARK